MVVSCGLGCFVSFIMTQQLFIDFIPLKRDRVDNTGLTFWLIWAKEKLLNRDDLHINVKT